MPKTVFNTFSDKRDYDKEPIVIKDYSYFFGVSLEYFSVIIGSTIIFHILCLVMDEKIEIWILFVPLIVSFVFVFFTIIMPML